MYINKINSISFSTKCYNKNIIGNVIFAKVNQLKDIDEKKTIRSGIILYDNDMNFYFGLDNSNHQYTDFGGGVSYIRNHEDFIDAAIREFNEETLNSICLITRDELKNSYCLLSNYMILFFVKKKIDFSKTIHQFNYNKKQHINSSFNPQFLEVIALIKLKKKELISLVTSNIDNKFYYRTKNHLQLVNLDNIFEKLEKTSLD